MVLENSSDEEVIEVNNHLQQEALSNDIDIRSILSVAEDLQKQIQLFAQQQDHCKDELDSCIDACYLLQRKLQHYNSATTQSKTFSQMTMYDFFGHQSV